MRTRKRRKETLTDEETERGRNIFQDEIRLCKNEKPQHLKERFPDIAVKKMSKTIFVSRVLSRNPSESFVDQ